MRQQERLLALVVGAGDRLAEGGDHGRPRAEGSRFGSVCGDPGRMLGDVAEGGDELVFRHRVNRIEVKRIVVGSFGSGR